MAGWLTIGLRRASVPLASLLAAGVLLAGLDHALPPPPMPEVSALVTDREGRALRAFPVEDGRWRLPVDPEAVDPAFLAALIEIEDQRFYTHHGVDPLAMARAVGSLISSGRIVSGGSTITMQTARLLEPRPRRTIIAKLIEMVRAIQLERRYSKHEILQAYLTLAPYGGNLEGVRAASWAWFGHEPDVLTPDEIALLIALPQAPEARRPDLRPDAAMASRARLLARMERAGLISADWAADAAEEPAPSRRAFPARAWHASQHLARAGGEVLSTIDIRLQSALETRLETLANEAGPDVQASALIVSLDGREVRAAVGSAGRGRPGGWIDLTRRARSPGSVLKPFIYGLAFEDGLAGPGTRIADLPRRFADYNPENFDRSFRGDVTIAEALQHSLNVPAVQVLDAVGANRFLAAMSFAGGRAIVPRSTEGDAGLAIALGGLGITAEEIAVMFAALGAGGEALPLAWTPEAAAANRESRGFRLLDRSAAATLVDVLQRSPAPPGLMPARLTSGAPAIAYKTGTSYGFRDAWAAGVSGNYAVVVWVGRADGAPRPGETGRQAALPALFDIFDVIARRDPSGVASRTDSLVARNATGPLARFDRGVSGPDIVFPPDGAEVWADEPGRGFALSARGIGPLRWYQRGVPVALDAGGQSLWQPQGPGFYELTVVDADGRSARTRVRVRMPAPS
ncbi:penicillin-binding protein 1C [Glycocaulis alkaliphilus]|uniref:peptidoglycan glycosyltransferase n=1 Tax=Glycocaulis alkaliphilus TaxID=1434191 RepID=A0A3T0ECR2_9PROT|nr:penicillin-binding protein 1C [Glycocaulis alkaliphilus]AZU05078.1 penicillin-binding protein 1C [Glycocaulis alkaliphilus]